MASVQCAILQKAPGSVSFHLCQFNSLEGQEYEHVRRRFSGAVVCGIVRKNSFVPILNPAADEKMEPGDRIIALAPQGEMPARGDSKPRVGSALLGKHLNSIAQALHDPTSANIVDASHYHRRSIDAEAPQSVDTRRLPLTTKTSSSCLLQGRSLLQKTIGHQSIVTWVSCVCSRPRSGTPQHPKQDPGRW